MEEVELVAKFESEETARVVARAMNAWVHWIWEGNIDDPPELFEDFGLATDDYAYDRCVTRIISGMGQEWVITRCVGNI